ncbi:hypothetical protein BDY24DRAFT_438566 [Mrakia frigida]|uniref:uncharacterized protein n=1 Tax=Mrakia frigida TaxID=29902 RepID=UPI003FCC262F
MALRPEDQFKTIEQYLGITCFFCSERKGDRDPSACVRCKRVSYCSKECQKLDYKVHRHICIAITACLEGIPLSSALDHPVLTSIPPKPSDLTRLMESMSTKLMRPLCTFLGTRMGRISTGLALNIPRCSHCALAQSDVEGGRLRRCTDCVYRFCSRKECGRAAVEHRTSGLCSKLQQIADDERFIRDYEVNNPSDHIAVYLPPRLIRDETPLPLDWNSYFDSLPFPPAVEPAQQRTMAMHSLSIPLTIVASLARLGLLPKFSNRNDRSRLLVHLVGAEKHFEIQAAVYEEINHLLPGVSFLQVVMVGKNLGVSPWSDGASETQKFPCQFCVQEMRGREVKFYDSTTYHDWLASPDFLPDPPDLVLAFNSGISERPSSWKPTVLALLERRVPVVFTSLNEMEANADASAIWRMGGDRIERLWDEEKNPWASGREHFDVFSPGLIWSENMYWFGFRGV